ncbi:hypothetical protein [Enterobacter sp. Bisph1]|uniref:hypothetical protein n=1 Tax=Enterobacter sp. Bisph1 TaxID=1274399 RepID=UPI00057BD91F|nr:hypothetical protein [Enterobacter sp. Bisph1]
MPLNKINAKKNGIYDALLIDHNVDVLSDTTVNKLLQILHDDLRNVSNIVFAHSARKKYYNPAASLTADIARRFIQKAGRKNNFGILLAAEREYLNHERLLYENLSVMPGFESCKYLVEKMFSKILFLQELLKAKDFLRESPIVQTDQNRNEILSFISRAEAKAHEQKK